VGSDPTGSELDDFYEASSLHAANVRDFTARATGYEPAGLGAVHRFVGAEPVVELRPVRDRTQRWLAARRSDRTFSARPLDERDVGRILAAVGPAGTLAGGGRRLVPEAGGLDAVFAFAWCASVRGRFGGRMLRYDHRRHGVADLGPCPSHERLRELFLLDQDDVAALYVVLVIDDAEVRAKYGERGGRFVLQQVGHAAQNIGLRLAADRHRGYVVVGGQDVAVLTHLGLAHTGARYGTTVACGR